MEKALQIQVDLFIDTFSTLKKQYKWSVGDLSLRFISLIYVLSNKSFQKDEFDEMVKYIKKQSKWYSYYRGHQMYSMAALLVTKFQDPQQAFDNLIEYEEKMKDGGFKSSSYLSIAAYALLLTCTNKQVETRIERARTIYKEMKKNHFWLTSSDDYPIAILLADSNKENNILIKEIESNYDMLHGEGFSRSNGLQFLSHILTFSNGSSHINAQHTRDIYDRLKQEKLHVSTTYYGILGYLLLLGEYSTQAVEEVIDVVGYLKTHKNFKWVQKDINIMVGIAIVANQYMERISQDNKLLETGIGISIETMIAAQIAVLIAAASAVAVASSAGS